MMSCGYLKSIKQNVLGLQLMTYDKEIEKLTHLRVGET